MKKLKFLVFTLIALFAGLISVNAASVEVDTEDELRAALESGKSVVLTDDIVLTETTEIKEDRPTAIAINGEGTITIDGNGYTISTSSVRTIFEIYATGSEKLNITLNDVVLENSYAGGRCIDTRTRNIVLNINDSELSTTKRTYDQALTIGGAAYTTPIDVNIKNTNISSEYYAVIAFNPVKLTIDGGTAVGGYAAIYMKEGSNGSVIDIQAAEIIGTNVSTAPVCAEGATNCYPTINDFGTFVFEDTGIKVNALNNSIIKATMSSTATEYIVLDSTNGEEVGNTLTIKDSKIIAASENVVKIHNENTKIVVGDKSVTNFEVPEMFLATDAKVVNTGTNEYTVYEPHTITIKDSANGKVLASASKAYLGDEITLTITPDKGYELSTIGFNFANEEAGEDLTGRTSFTMADKDIVITATFEKIKYNVLDHAGENGAVKFDKELAASGEEVTMTITPDEGYIISEINIIDKDNNVIEVKDNKFIMPESDVWVRIEFIKEIKTEIPVIDTTEKVEEVTVGVKEDNKIEEDLKESLAADEDLIEKVKDTDVKVVVDVFGVDKEKLDEKVVSAITEKAGKGVIAEYFDITIAVKEAKTDKEIATISELTKEIELTILLPENLKNTNKDINRKYFIIREHEGVVSTIEAKLSEDGNSLTFKSKDFSTYALAYEDKAIENKPEQENPKTGDNVIFYAIAGIVSICGLGVIIKNKKFN